GRDRGADQRLRTSKGRVDAELVEGPGRNHGATPREVGVAGGALADGDAGRVRAQRGRDPGGGARADVGERDLEARLLPGFGSPVAVTTWGAVIEGRAPQEDERRRDLLEPSEEDIRVAVAPIRPGRID